MKAPSHLESFFAKLFDVTNALPLWIVIIGILMVALVISLPLVLIIRFSVRRLRQFSPKLKRRIWISIGVFLVVYIGLYFGTTTVQPEGHGGLTGPLKVRVFQSEKHLIVFYPLYLAERRIRDGANDDAVYYFNITFKDGLYPHPWLYGDGVYGAFW